MNFSRNTKSMRLLSLIAVLILMTALFTGCGKKDDSTIPSTEPELNLNLNLTPSETQTTEAETLPPETTAPVISEKSATVISQLNIRSAPSTNGSSVIGTLYAGDKITVERREQVSQIWWAYISEPTTGWVCMDFVEMDIPEAANNNTSTPAATQNPDATTPNDNSSTTTSTKGVVTANGGLMIRSEASTNGDVKGMYSKGEVVTILETKNGWGRTNKGWINLSYVNTTGTTTNNTTTTTNTNTTGNGSTTVQLRGVVKVNELNIRGSASTDADRVGTYNYGTRVEILEKSGSWGRTNKGWIHLDYVYQDCTTGTNTATGTITATALRIRQSPSTNADVVGSYQEGDSVKILEQFTFGGTKWGCTNKGWISMDYVNTGSGTSSSDNDDSLKGFVTTDGLRIRSGAGSSYEIVGGLDDGDNVTITAQKTVDGTTWGKISQGWISMDYVQLYD